MAWFDLNWLGVTWRYVTWRNITWLDLTWCNLTRFLRLDVTWHDLTWRMTWGDVTWLTWRDLTWLDLMLLKVMTWLPRLVNQRDSWLLWLTWRDLPWLDMTWRGLAWRNGARRKERVDVTWHDNITLRDFSWFDLTWLISTDIDHYCSWSVILQFNLILQQLTAELILANKGEIPGNTLSDNLMQSLLKVRFR